MKEPISRKILAGKSLLCLFAVLFAGYLLCWLIAESAFWTSDLNFRFNSRRYGQALRYLEAESPKKPLHLVIGASEIETGFLPASLFHS